MTMNNTSRQPQDERLRTLFALQRSAFAQDSCPDHARRMDRLDRLLAMNETHAAAIAEAISADFDHRSRHEIALAESIMVVSGIRHIRRHLKKWMALRRMPTALHFRPGYSRVIRQPLGVVGVISPWNYPYQLAILPAAAALAAGNRVLIKPSELTPRFCALLQDIVERSFREDECAVVTGDAEIGKAFAQLPFDHLFFTGSTAVGRQVALAAAANLTPVTLELGGKSPAIVDRDCDLERAVLRLAAGKFLNAGQTCVAPDYLLVPEDRVAPLVAALKAAVTRLYPSLAANPDYTSIVSARHCARLCALVEDARRKGARVLEINPAGEALPVAVRKLPPTLLLDVSDDMAAMQEEIFGPVLPIVTYASLDQAIDYVNRRARPLALYWFGDSRANRDRVLRETISGGVTVNDTLLHLCQEDLPFGGVGASGMGAYHGEYGYLACTKEKPVFFQSRFAGTSRLYPPYGKTFDSMLKLLKKIV